MGRPSDESVAAVAEVTTQTREATSALSSRNYRIYLIGTVFSMVGIWIQRLAIGWQAWQLSESAFVVGVIAAVQFLPILILTPFFGVLVDRIRARSGSVIMNAMMAVVAAILGIVTLNGGMSIEILATLALIHGLIVSFHTPTRLALIPDLVPPRLFPSAVATSSIAFNLSRFAGPTLAGAVIAVWGLGWAYIINALTYLPVILSLGLLTIDHASKPARVKAPYLEQLREGLRYTRDHPTIRLAIMIAAIGAFFGRGVLELMPAYAGMVFGGGSTSLAILMSAAGIGAIVASFFMSSTRNQGRLQEVLLFGGIGVGLAVMLLGLSTNMVVGVAAVALLGLSGTLVGVGSQSLVQVSVEDRLRGRVMSLWTLVAMGGPAVGSLAGGAIMREFGAALTSFIFAVLCFGPMVLIGVRRRAGKAAARKD